MVAPPPVCPARGRRGLDRSVAGAGPRHPDGTRPRLYYGRSGLESCPVQSRPSSGEIAKLIGENVDIREAFALASTGSYAKDRKIAALEAANADIVARHAVEVARLKAEHAVEVARLKAEHAVEVARLKARHEAEGQ